MTKISPIIYDPDASCQKWKEFLRKIMDSNQEIIDYLQRAVGYSLTGLTSEQCFFLCWGTGANGKSVFLKVIGALLGEYASQAEFSTFLEKNNSSIRNDLARLHGARFVTASEGDAGRALSESLVKQLTGGEKITARFLRREYFEFDPKFKIWLASNYKPQIKGSDEGIWRRIKLIPFSVTIPENERDNHLFDKLSTELPGILNWAIQGCVEWQNRRSLDEPSEISAATKEYKAEINHEVRQFFTDCCKLDKDTWTANRDLKKAFWSWLNENSETEIPQNEEKLDGLVKSMHELIC